MSKVDEAVYQLLQDDEWMEVNETYFHRTLHSGGAQHGRVCRYVLEPVASYDVQPNGSVLRSTEA